MILAPYKTIVKTQLSLLKKTGSRLLSSFIKVFDSSKWLDKNITNSLNSPTKMARAFVIANVLKDMVGSVFYVSQSYNNEKMPEDKRKLVAALDLANGAAMCFFQLLLGFTISDKAVQDRLAKKLFGSFEHTNPARFLTCKTGLATITSLLISAIIAKRVITPLVTTPMAFKIKEKYIDKNDNPTKLNPEHHTFNPDVVYKLAKSKMNFAAYPNKYGNPLSVTNSGDKLKI